MTLQSSQRLPELLFYTKKSYRILQLQFQLQFYKGTHTTIHHLHPHVCTSIHPENSPSRIQFYMQKTKSSSSTTTFQKGNSTHRDLLEIHPCILQGIPDIPVIPDLPKAFQAFQPQDLPKALQTFQTLQSIQTFQPFQAILQVPVSPGIPPQYKHSPTRMHILYILQILQFDWFAQKLHRAPVGQLQTFYSTDITFFKEREMLQYRSKHVSVDIGRCQDDIFSRIELIPSFILSGEKTNYRNDIQLFPQLFDELNYH